MSFREKLIRARMGMLALAEELSNVSRACRRAGIGRRRFSEIKDAYEKYGREGLAPRSGGGCECRTRRGPSWPLHHPFELFLTLSRIAIARRDERPTRPSSTAKWPPPKPLERR